MPYLYFAFICLVWGGSFILMKKATVCFSPLAVGGWRVAAGAVVLGLVWLSQRSNRRGPFVWPLSQRDWLPVAGVTLLGYAWPYCLQPYLVALHGSGLIGMTVSFVPLLTVLVSVPLLGVYPTPRQLAGVCGGLACLGVLMADGLDRHVPPWDWCLAMTVPLCYALTNTYTRRRLSHLRPLTLSWVSLTFATATVLPLAYGLPGAASAASPGAPQAYTVAVYALLTLGAVGTGATTYLFNRLILEEGPLFAGMVTYLVPLGALSWGWLDAERVTPLQMAALAGILVMVALTQYGAAPRRPG